MKRVKVRWTSEVEHLEGEFQNAMLIVPEGAADHRVYFTSMSAEQLGKMVAVVIEMATRNGGGRAMAIAMQILRDNEPGEFRGKSESAWPDDRHKS